MDEKTHPKGHGDSDSGQSPSDHERTVDKLPIDAVDGEIPDPDAHLSEEERKKMYATIPWFAATKRR